MVADMEAYSDSAVPSMATRVECLRLAQASIATSSEPGAVLPCLGRLVSGKRYSFCLLCLASC